MLSKSIPKWKDGMQKETQNSHYILLQLRSGRKRSSATHALASRKHLAVTVPTFEDCLEKKPEDMGPQHGSVRPATK